MLGVLPNYTGRVSGAVLVSFTSWCQLCIAVEIALAVFIAAEAGSGAKVV